MRTGSWTIGSPAATWPPRACCSWTPPEYEDGELDKWVTGGDVAPEGLLFLDASISPTGEALLLAACEVSGTVAVYQVGGAALSVLPFTDVEARDVQAVRPDGRHQRGSF